MMGNENCDMRSERCEMSCNRNMYSRKQGFDDALQAMYSRKQGFDGALQAMYSRKQGFDDALQAMYSRKQGFDDAIKKYSRAVAGAFITKTFNR